MPKTLQSLHLRTRSGSGTATHVGRRPAVFLGCALMLLLGQTALVARCSAAFVHPGALVTRAELDFARAKVAAGQQPWTGALSWMQSRSDASLSYTPAPVPDVSQDAYGTNDVGGWDMMYDARAAYLHALLWAVTDNAANAQKSIQILNAWSSTLRSIGGVNGKLIGAGALTGFENAAELLKHGNAGWSASDQAKFVTMLRTIGYPLIQDFQPGYNGNWDAIITHSMMDMGVFLDDQAIFDRAANYYRNGVGNGSLPNYVSPDGTTQETARDCEHETMGISGLVGSAETAWHQGIDLFGHLNNLLFAGVEGVASRAYNCGLMPTPYPCWEMAYNHFHDTLGLPMPNTALVLAKIGVRPEGYGPMTGIGYGTLTSFATAVPASSGAPPAPQAWIARLEQNVPNPFNPSTTIHYTLREGTHARVDIYDVAGKRVRTLVDELQSGGPHAVSWGGRDEMDNPVPSGVYYYRLCAGDYTGTHRLILLK
jgi:hypothetical protein